MRESTARRIVQKRVYRNWLRSLRVVEVLDLLTVAEGSPVEIKTGYTVSDRETGELFLVLVFKSLSQRPISALDIRVMFYDESHPVPFRKDDFRYSHETATLGERRLDGKLHRERSCKREQALVYGEEFGQWVLLSLPDNYFHRMQMELVCVTYEDGGCEPIRLTVYQKAIRRPAAEGVGETFPARPISPAEGKQEQLLRDLPQAQVKRVLKEERMERIRELHDTSAYVRLRRFETKEELNERIEQHNRALTNLAAQERERKHRLRMLPVKLALVAFLALVLIHYEELTELLFALFYRLLKKG